MKVPIARWEQRIIMLEKKLHAGGLRVAFAYTHNAGWPAGTYYLKNLFYALKSLSDKIRPEIILLVGEKAATEEYEELLPWVDEVLHQPATESSPVFVELIKKIGTKLRVIPKKNNLVSAFLKTCEVDILFTRGIPSYGFQLPFLTWIPDFQHIHYPEFFSEQEVKIRDAAFERFARNATRIVLSSNSALKDFQMFAPWSLEKARVISFVAQIPGDTFQRDPGYVCGKYNIPERFILLPNQFWKHKNHETVIYALRIALKKYPELTIVCTGNTNESRDFNYFSKLLCLISSVGVRERMIILGLTPRQDLFSLMRQAVAVLQPSLFEGWNTTVEEVKSMGKQLIVSDIPVHREQNAPGAVYFDPKDSQSLSLSLLEVFKNGRPGSNLELEKAAKESLNIRTEQYGKNFLKVACEAMESLSQK